MDLDRVTTRPGSRRRAFEYHRTPDWLATRLLADVDWSTVASVLDPAVGQGELLGAIPGREGDLSITAVDLQEFRPTDSQLRLARIIRGDFLALDESEHRRVDLVVANPPYRPWHRMRRMEQNSALNGGFQIQPPRPNLWSLFLERSLAWLNEGGSMRFLVPAAIAGGGQWEDFLVSVKQRFANTNIAVLDGTPFDTAQERIAILSLSDYLGHEVEVESSATAKSEVSETPTLGDYLTTRIGVVLAPKRFYLAESLADCAGFARPPAPFAVSAADLSRASQRGWSGPWLRQHADLTASTEWIRGGLAAGLDQGYHARRRSPWHRIRLPDSPPDVLLQAVWQDEHRAVENVARVFCSNSLLGGWWKPDVSSEFKQRLLAGWPAEQWQENLRESSAAVGKGALRVRLSDLAKQAVPLEWTGNAVGTGRNIADTNAERPELVGAHDAA